MSGGIGVSCDVVSFASKHHYLTPSDPIYRIPLPDWASLNEQDIDRCEYHFILTTVNMSTVLTAFTILCAIILVVR